MLKYRGRIAAAFTSLSILLANAANAAWELDMPRGVTTLSDSILGLHHLILGICTVAAVLVFGVLAYALFKFRRSRGVTAAQFHHSTLVEIIWTTIPVLVLIFMAVPSAREIIKIEDASSPDMSIKVTGYQWKWGYEYLDEGISFYSNLDAASSKAARLNSGIAPESVDNYLRNVDRPMVVPVNKKIRLLLTSNDVIHAWWVPELYVKKDANPGFVNEMWFTATETGTFRGQCVELCGRGHGFMPVVVEVLSQSDYDAWVVAQKDKPATAAVNTNPAAATQAAL